jgi:sugar phosphate permease
MLANSALAILLMGFPLGFAQSAMNAGVGPFLSELFPTRLRATGQGFCYNAGRGVGAALPALVGVFSANMSLTLAICGAAAFAYAMVVAASFLLPETRGVVLTGQT